MAPLLSCYLPILVVLDQVRSVVAVSFMVETPLFLTAAVDVVLDDRGAVLAVLFSVHPVFLSYVVVVAVVPDQRGAIVAMVMSVVVGPRVLMAVVASCGAKIEAYRVRFRGRSKWCGGDSTLSTSCFAST